MFKLSLIAAAVLFGIGSAALADDIRVVVNGQPVRMAMGPREYNGRVMVPMRGVFERLGANVDWDRSSQTVTATRNDTNIQLTIGSRFAQINGERVAMDVPAMVLAGATYIPLRFVSEALGSDVTWDGRAATVIIATGERVAARPYRRAHAFRSVNALGPNWLPTVSSVTSNISDGCIHAGQTVKVTMNATPGGKAWFRVRMVFGESKMTEVSPGVYEGTWTEPAGREYRINNNDILAFVLIGDRATAEFSPGS